MGECVRTSWLNAPHQGRMMHSRGALGGIGDDDTFHTSLKNREELVCNITYPGTRPTDLGDEFANEEKRPVVVLLGWTGSQDKNLVKYSSIYEESCITVRCTIPGNLIVNRRNRLPDVGRRVVQVIIEKRLNEHPIFFVILSGGGAIFYQQISLAMQQAGSPLKVKGAVFDSGPGERTLAISYTVARIVLGKHPLNLPLACTYTLVYSFLWFCEVMSEMMGKNIVPADPKCIITEPYTWPQMFLYSNADTIAYPTAVEAFASERANKGVRTQLVLFKDSPHLKHIFNYRDIYINTVYRFMKECLEEQINENSDKDRDETVIPNLTKRIILPQV